MVEVVRRVVRRRARGVVGRCMVDFVLGLLIIESVGQLIVGLKVVVAFSKTRRWWAEGLFVHHSAKRGRKLRSWG